MEPDVWTQSSACHTTNCCVGVKWRKSSLSTDVTTCVEVGFAKVVRRDEEEIRDEPSDLEDVVPVWE